MLAFTTGVDPVGPMAVGRFGLLALAPHDRVKTRVRHRGVGESAPVAVGRLHSNDGMMHDGQLAEWMAFVHGSALAATRRQTIATIPAVRTATTRSEKAARRIIVPPRDQHAALLGSAPTRHPRGSRAHRSGSCLPAGSAATDGWHRRPSWQHRRSDRHARGDAGREREDHEGPGLQDPTHGRPRPRWRVGGSPGASRCDGPSRS